MDPHYQSGTSGVMHLMYNSLLGYVNEKGDNFELRPELAESWEIVNPTTIVLKLRKGVKFHDGSDFNADVAKWNIERMQGPKSGAKIHVANIKSVDVVDDYTIRLNLSAPTAPLLTNLTATDMFPFIVSKAQAEKYGDQFGQHPSGTGPFQFVNWVKDQSVNVKRFDGYWEKGADGKPLPYLDGVSFKYNMDVTVSLIDLRAGQLDLVSDVPLDQVPLLKTQPNLALYANPWSGRNYNLAIHTSNGPFAQNKKLRDAVFYAIDRDGVGKAIAGDLGVGSYYFWSKYQIGYNDKLPRYTYDPNKAKQLLAEAGYPNGIDMKFIVIARKPDDRTAEAVDQMMRNVGIRSKLSLMERVAWVGIVSSKPPGDYDMTQFMGNLDPDPDLLSKQFVTNAVWNWNGWSNKDMDACMEESRSTYDKDQRQKIYERCQQIVYENAYFTTTWYGMRYDAVQKSVKGYQWGWKYPWLRGAWLDR